MKKTVFLALLALVFLASDCVKPEKTDEDLLTQKKGWTLLTATANPAYTNNDDVTSENLFVSFFYECELNDVLFFYDTKSSIMKEFCDDPKGKENSLGNWRFKSDYEILEFHLPYFKDAADDKLFALLEGKKIALEENTLTLRIPIEFADKSIAGKSGLVLNERGVRGAKSGYKGDFTLTYKVAK
jgi:hypothetical protein